jgi:hypothetical protein
MTKVQELPQAPVEKAPIPQAGLSPAEWAQLRTEDKQAAAAIVCLMGTIFILGLIGYTVICLVAAG